MKFFCLIFWAGGVGGNLLEVNWSWEAGEPQEIPPIGFASQETNRDLNLQSSISIVNWFRKQDTNPQRIDNWFFHTENHLTIANPSDPGFMGPSLVSLKKLTNGVLVPKTN